ncbi:MULTISPECIES: entry exclusion protein 1 [Pseudomonas]|uniref:entry exclusion protein 1 n=1 Tax=Pseudomonas TaxID=286 RepID=UPI001113F33A|nr:MULTISPECIES: entry exclusion protein 1 [Pseudomonas]
MPSLTLGRMAKLYGLHRSSLYQAVAEGRVSSGHDGKGQRVIDLAEMIRVYGEPPASTRHPIPNNPTSSTAQPDTIQTPDIAALIEELKALRGEIAELRETMKFLEHKPNSIESGKKPESEDNWANDLIDSLRQRSNFKL